MNEAQFKGAMILAGLVLLTVFIAVGLDKFQRRNKREISKREYLERMKK